ncbi:hypothetical protein [Mesorhizobium sp. M2A.F.Ca.ET.039.01.1.1]|uniref:hypothetical protein n=1 Tax=Mesorhizobium sp. M2A.F.Ca.ET.039.01.1.1 TaxID=2496746 RepID=UPI000FCA0CB6|nr:hypothetical protein [Mesorhizobium sp. M2A.F.Ca.ET.039.01.1.1]RWX72534.1 hypothetical protein EOA24_00645 [Mesorhizobium sp. M2A.F.Ca.ET.039.01.1.1]
MAREAFIEKPFSEPHQEVIRQANAIIAEYQRQGFTLTLRQLYYQFVSRDLIANKQTEYKRLGSIVNAGRLAGLIDWSAIEDRTRNVRKPNVWDSPSQIIDAVAEQYQEDIWQGQHYRPEVWIEKDALVGVIEPICERYRVPYFACRGYSSQSEQYAAGLRFRRIFRAGLTPIVLHLGDHDPSGIDMTRDNADRLSMFAGREVEVRRLALNWEQIEEHDPPPNPAKETDSRSGGYIEQFGDSSWELDALDPPTIEGLIEAELDELIDREAWDARVSQEETAKGVLADVSHNWDEVVTFLRGEGEGA